MTNPHVSVIIPAYNEEKYIEKCLSSLIKLDFPKEQLEIILVNNNSKDKTREIVKKNFPTVRIIDEERQGVVFARIAGVNAAKGKIIAFTDADTVVPPDWLTKIMKEYDNFKVVAVGGPRLLSPYNFRAKIDNLLVNPFFFIFKIFPGHNMSFRKEAYLAGGGFSTQSNLAEDFYINHQLKKVGKVIIINNPVSTSSRRPLSDMFFFEIKYFINILLITLFNCSLFQKFKAFRD